MSVKQVFDGTPSTVIAQTATIADGVFTVDSTNCTITEFDNSADLWPYAVLRLELPDGFASAPNDGSVINVYMAPSDQGGSNDPLVPTTSNQKGAVYVGRVRVHADTGAMYPSEILVPLLGVRQCKFFLENRCGQTMSYSTGFTLTAEGCSVQDV